MGDLKHILERRRRPRMGGVIEQIENATHRTLRQPSVATHFSFKCNGGVRRDGPFIPTADELADELERTAELLRAKHAPPEIEIEEPWYGS